MAHIFVLLAAVSMLGACRCSLNCLVRFEEPEVIRFATSEGTSMNVDVSPDGTKLLFDLLGDIYELPVEGGEAILVRGGTSWDSAPQYSPNGKHIAFLSDATGGNRNLFVMAINGTGVRQISEDSLLNFSWLETSQGIVGTKVNHRSAWSGSPTLYSTTNDNLGWSLDVPGNVLDRAVVVSSMNAAVFQLQGYPRMFHQASLTGVATLEPIEDRNSNAAVRFKPELSPDGRLLAYLVRSVRGTSLRILNLSNNHSSECSVWKSGSSQAESLMRAALFRPNYSFDPSGRSIYISFNGKLHRVNLENCKTELIPFLATVDQKTLPQLIFRRDVKESVKSVKTLRWVNLAGNREIAVFSAVGKIWVADLLSGSVSRLTNSELYEYAPSLSPDNSKIAFSGWASDGSAQIYVVNMDGSELRSITTKPGLYAQPKWTPDGMSVVFLERDVEVNEEVSEFFDGSLELRQSFLGTGPSRAIGNYSGTFQNWLITNVTMSQQADRLFILELGLRDNVMTKDLVSIDLRTGSRSTQYVFTADIEAVIPSPLEDKIAILVGPELWVMDYEPIRFSAEPMSYETIVSQGRLLASVGGYQKSIHWTNESTLSWTIASDIHSMDFSTDDASQVYSLEFRPRREATKKTLVLTQGSVFTTDNLAPPTVQTLVVVGNAIASLESGFSSTTDNDVTINLAGKYLIPGLIDTHAHPFFVNAEYQSVVHPDMVSMMAYGVTTLFDPSAPTFNVLSMAEREAFGNAISPRILTTGEAFSPSSFARIFDDLPLGSSRESTMRTLVDTWGDFGVDMLKSHSLPRRDQEQLLVDASSKLGLPAVLHAEPEDSRRFTAVLDGYRAVEHFYSDIPCYRDWSEFFGRSKVHLTPTLALFLGQPSLLREIYGEGLREDRKLRRFSRPQIFPYRLASLYPDPFSSALSSREDSLSCLKSIHKAGGRISIGSHSSWGLDTHIEMWAMVRGGFSELDALRAATIVGAEKLGVENDLGSIEKGKLADLLVLRCNPLENIRCTADIEYVVKGGVVWHADSMTQMWPEYRPLPKPWWHSDEDWEELKPELPEPWGRVPIADGAELEQPSFH